MGFGSDKTGFYKPSAVTVTASGNPLTLQNAKRLRKLTIYGNAVQDGTPSPDVPVEVQLCGDRTGNLLDVTRISGPQIEVADNKIYLSDYACSTLMSPKTFLEMTGLNPGDTITCSNSAEVISGTANEILGRVAFSTKNEGTSLILCSNNTRTVTIPSDFNNDNYTNLLLYGAVIPDESDERLVVMSNLAIYKGSYTADTLPAYEPYGYKVSGRTEGLNLFDISKYTYANGNSISTSNSTGASWSGRFIDIDYAIELGKTYTLVCDYLVENASDTSTIRFGYATDRGMMAFTNGLKTVHGKGSIVFSVTVPESIDNYNNFSLYINSSMDDTPTIGDKMTISNIMIVQGSYTAETMPPYEPYQPPQDFAVYLPEQIAKVGDVADEVVVDMEKQTAELVRRIERNEFKGTDAWKNDWFPAIVKNLPETAPAIPSARCVSNHFDHNGDTSVPITQIANVVGTTISVARANLISGVTDAETFKTWLSDKNVYAYYPLAEPVTTDITSLQQWDAMPQVSGTVTLTLSAEVDPSGAEAVYTATKRPKAQAALIEENTIPEEPAETQVSDTDINTEIIMMED